MLGPGGVCHVPGGGGAHAGGAGQGLNCMWLISYCCWLDWGRKVVRKSGKGRLFLAFFLFIRALTKQVIRAIAAASNTVPEVMKV